MHVQYGDTLQRVIVIPAEHQPDVSSERPLIYQDPADLPRVGPGEIMDETDRGRF